MVRMFTCERGHAWEAVGESEVAPVHCPTCGLPPDFGPLLQSDAAEGTSEVRAPIPAEAPLLDAGGLPVIAGYENLLDLGRTVGGVRLYRARQKVVGRTVLLQVVLAKEYNSERAWNYLRGEASAHGKLSHPNIASVFEVGERDRQLFFNAMEFIDGPTLADAAGNPPLPLRQVAPLMELLARAVAHASERQVIHRHLEPSVIVLQKVAGPKTGPAKDDPGGAVCCIHNDYFIPRIRGFGLARPAVEGDAVDADLFAEAGYLSPEQAGGRASKLGPHTDVYGLGGILYFLLCGRMPFRGPTVIDIVDAIQTAPLVPPSDLRRVPAGLQHVCKKALARPTGRRYAQAGAMADDLRRAALHLPLPSGKVSALRRLGGWCRRRPGVAVLWLVALAGLLGSVLNWGSGEGNRSRSVDREAPTSRWLDAENLPGQLQEKEEFIDWYQKQFYQHAFVSAARQVAVNSPTAPGALKACPQPERGIEWHYLLGLLKKKSRLALPGTASMTSIAWLSKGHLPRLATALWHEGSQTSIVTVWNLPDKTVLHKYEFPHRLTAMISPGQGDKLAVVDGVAGGRLRIIDEEQQQSSATLQGPTGISARRDGDRLVVTNSFGQGQFHLTETGKADGPPFAITDRAGQQGATRVLYRPDEATFATYVVGEKVVKEWEDSQPPRLQRKFEEDGAIACIAYGPSGHLAVADGKGGVVVHPPTGDILCVPPRLSSGVKQMAFSPDGKRLVLACADDTLRILAFLPAIPDLLASMHRGDLDFVGGEDLQRGESWSEILSIPVSGVSGLAFGPGGKTLTAVGPKGVVLLGNFSE